MLARLTARNDGQVDVVVDDPQLRMFSDALKYCVSSLPTRGAEGNGPSTYWVDVASAGLDRAQASASDVPIIGGNISELRLTDGRIEARRDYWEEDEVGEFTEPMVA